LDRKSQPDEVVAKFDRTPKFRLPLVVPGPLVRRARTKPTFPLFVETFPVARNRQRTFETRERLKLIPLPPTVEKVVDVKL